MRGAGTNHPSGAEEFSMFSVWGLVLFMSSIFLLWCCYFLLSYSCWLRLSIIYLLINFLDPLDFFMIYTIYFENSTNINKVKNSPLIKFTEHKEYHDTCNWNSRSYLGTSTHILRGYTCWWDLTLSPW